MQEPPELNEYQQMVKSDAQNIRDLATKAKAAEIDFIEDGGGGEGSVATPEIEEGSKEWNEIYDGYDWIITFFDMWMDIPDPKDSEAIVNQLGEVVGESDLKHDDNAVGNIDPGNNLLGSSALDGSTTIMAKTASNWEGAAADAFQLMMGNLEPALHNQIALGKILRQMAIANYHVVHSVRRDVRQLQKDTITALEASMEGPGFDWKALQMTLMIVGTALSFTGGVAAIPAVTGFLASQLDPADPDDAGKRKLGNATSSLTLINAVIGLRTLLPQEQEAAKDGGPLGASTVDGILDNMASGLTTISSKMSEAEDAIVEVCNANINLINSSDKNGSSGVIDAGKAVVVAPRPAKMVNDPGTADERFRPSGTPV